MNGLLPGIKIGSSNTLEPLTVEYKLLPISKSLNSLIKDHFIIFYTGKARLAKNLLQVRKSQMNA